MKIHLLSDLHLEFFVSGWKPDPQTLAVADVVVLAGDIDQGVAGLDCAKQHLQGKPVIYVAGNHEFFGGDWNKTPQQLRVVSRASGIHFLENDAVTIGAVRFLGCTLWTDFNYFNTPAETMSAYEAGFPDCHAISVDSTPTPGVPERFMRSLLSPQQVRERHQRSRAWLEGQFTDESSIDCDPTHARCDAGRRAAPEQQ